MNDIGYTSKPDDTGDNYNIKELIKKKRTHPSKNTKYVGKGIQNIRFFNDDDDSDNEDNTNYRNGRWLPCEHIRFVKGCLAHGNNWKKVKILLLYI